MQIVDADGHVAEGASLALEAMKRWPQYIKLRTDGRPQPDDRGPPLSGGRRPGCRLPARARAEPVDGIDCSTAQGVLGDADRDHIDTMVLYPSFGLCAPSLEDPEFAAGFARLYNQWIADYCRPTGGRLRGVAVTPIEHGAVAIDIMREAKELGLVATMIPPALKTRNLDHPDLDRVLRRRRRARHAARRPRRARASTCRRSASTASPTTSRCTASASRSTR